MSTEHEDRSDQHSVKVLATTYGRSNTQASPSMVPPPFLPGALPSCAVLGQVPFIIPPARFSFLFPMFQGFSPYA